MYDRMVTDALPPFVFSEDQEDLRRTLNDFLARESSVERVFAHIECDDGYDRTVWAKLAGQIGLAAILVPEAYGGVGGTQVDMAVALEETGAALLCAPYFSTIVLATNALLEADDAEACADFLPTIAEGRTVATLATDPRRAGTEPLHAAAQAAHRDNAWTLNGSALVAIDGEAADLILVVAKDPNGVASLFAVAAGAQGVTRSRLGTLDLTRRQARIDLDGASARLVGAPGAGLEILARVLDLAATATAIEQIGGAQRCLDDAVAYTKQRIQFGRPIASFQAVKHLCADLLVELELGRSAAYYAAWTAAHSPDELPRAAAMARLWCSELFEHVAEESLQLHGGIGMTWEHHTHLYLRRAKSAELLLSGKTYHRRVLAAEIERDRLDVDGPDS